MMRVSGMVLAIIMLMGITARSYAQQYDTSSIFKEPITLDTFVIKSGFDVHAFIRRVRSDTTFYKAFRSMHLVPYTAVNNITAYDKKGRVAAAYYSKTLQDVQSGCRTTKVLEEQTSGDFYTRKGDYNYYTAELFAYLFLTKGVVCNENDIVAGAMNEYGKGQLEKRKYELKQLIFNPGSKVSGIPFMSDRASIFDADEAKRYNFSIVKDLYDSVDCYVFRITPKKEYEHNVLYNDLTTWFRKSDYSILARNYSLSYHTLVYDFNVTMKVRTSQKGNKLYPTRIDYDGDWHVFTKKRERVKFSVAMAY